MKYSFSKIFWLIILWFGKAWFYLFLYGSYLLAFFFLATILDASTVIDINLFEVVGMTSGTFTKAGTLIAEFTIPIIIITLFAQGISLFFRKGKKSVPFFHGLANHFVALFSIYLLCGVLLRMWNIPSSFADTGSIWFIILLSSIFLVIGYTFVFLLNVLQKGITQAPSAGHRPTIHE